MITNNSAVRMEHGFWFAEAGFLPAVAAAVFLSTVAPSLPLMAQGLDSEGAIETIIGTDVATEETEAMAHRERVEKAIAASLANAAEVRKRFRLNHVEIVFLPDLDNDTPIDARIEENKEQIAELRTSIEGSAMFYHAIDSRSVPLRKVVALEFSGDDVTIFAMGSAPSQ